MILQLWIARDSRREAERDGGQVAVNSKKGTSVLEFSTGVLECLETRLAGGDKGS